MKAVIRMLVAGMLVAVLPFAAAGAEVDREGLVVAGTPYEWDGAATTGTAFENMIGEVAVEDVVVSDGLQCSKNPDAYCETTLVGFDLTLTEDEIAAGKTRKTVTGEIAIGTPTVPLYDYDLKIYESDAAGTKGAEVASVGDLDETPGEETATVSGIRGTIEQPIKHYLVEVIYFFSVQGSYSGVARMLGTPRAS